MKELGEHQDRRRRKTSRKTEGALLEKDKAREYTAQNEEQKKNKEGNYQESVNAFFLNPLR